MKKHIVVIGGGVAGCAAAYTLRKKGYEVTIIEREDHLGGRTHSEKVGDLTFEMGAVFLTNFYTNILAFLKETGLDNDLQKRKSNTFIVRNGVPHSSAKWNTYIGNSWLSLGAKVRLFVEVFKILPAWRRLGIHDMWQADAYDAESVDDALSGKYGQELLNYLLEPALDGYMYWSPKRTSRALLMILLKAALIQRHTYILKNGVQQIPERSAKGSKILLSHTVKHVKREADGTYSVLATDPKGRVTIQADGIVCATPASTISELISELTPKQEAFFQSIGYSSTVVAAYSMPRSKSEVTYAIVYPSAEGQPIAAMTVQADASSNTDLVKVYASGSTGKELCKKSDTEVRAVLSEPLPVDLTESVKAGEWRIQRWPEAIPEFTVGHLRKLRTLANGEIETPDSKLVFAGDYIGGPFMEGAFTSGIEAAARLDTQFS